MTTKPKYRGKRYYVNINPYYYEDLWVYGHSLEITTEYPLRDDTEGGWIEYDKNRPQRVYTINGEIIKPETLQYSIDGSEENFENVIKT